MDYREEEAVGLGDIKPTKVILKHTDKSELNDYDKPTTTMNPQQNIFDYYKLPTLPEIDPVTLDKIHAISKSFEEQGYTGNELFELLFDLENRFNIKTEGYAKVDDIYDIMRYVKNNKIKFIDLFSEPVSRLDILFEKFREDGDLQSFLTQANKLKRENATGDSL